MTLWTIFRSPLMIGSELTKHGEKELSLLTNKAITDMNKLSRHAHMVFSRKTPNTEIVLWTACCANGGQYAAVFNIGEIECNVDIPLIELEIYEQARIADLWNGTKKDKAQSIKAMLPAHGAAAYLINT